MSITINQQPLNYTPSNAQHIYNASSTLSGNTNFKYVFDVWMDPFTTPEKVARVKVAPNSSGVGIVDVGDIVKNYTKPNTRTDQKQVKDKVGGTSTFSNPNGQIPFALGGFIQSNELNDNPNYIPLPHVREYRVLVGEQYTTGGVTTLDICETPAALPTTWNYSLESAMVPYPGSPTRVNITGAGAQLPDYADTSLLGWSYLHQTNTGVFVASGTTTAQTGNYTATLEPTPGDFLSITETGSGCRFTFQWTGSDEFPPVYGWYFVDQFCPSCVDNPEVITIWPGVQQNKKIWNYNNSWWGNGNTDGVNNHLWYDLYKYKFKPAAQLDNDEPGYLLTPFGDEKYTFTFLNNLGNETDIECRKRTHHYQCPLLLSFFYRDFQTILPGARQPVFINSVNEGQLTFGGGALMTTFTSDITDNRIVYRVQNIQNLYPNNNIGFFLSTGTTSNASSLETNRISEAVVYQTYGDDCMSDPQHFLYLTQNGVWDTWTFDRKNIKTYSKENSTYAQGLIRDNAIYNPMFSSQRNIIYDQNVYEVVEAQSHYMNQNDRTIVEELFLSTHVYLMKDFYYDNIDADDYELTPHLIPVRITSSSLQEYKQRYNKVFQYTLTYEYNPIQQHRSNL